MVDKETTQEIRTFFVSVLSDCLSIVTQFFKAADQKKSENAISETRLSINYTTPCSFLGTDILKTRWNLLVRPYALVNWLMYGSNKLQKWSRGKPVKN